MSETADDFTYAYVLGLYLGDGYLGNTGRTWQLRICCADAHPRLIDECAEALTLLTMGRHVARYPGQNGSAMHVVCSGWKAWRDLFPQAGPGLKHLRPIVLEPWQQRIVDAEPEWFLRGLIHSDGCRTMNTFKTKLPSGRVAEYSYPRYFFSNESADIRGLFRASCDRLGIRTTMSNRRNVSVSHRDSVAKLDAFVGPKS